MTGTVLLIFTFVLGAVIGSFLNVCIHRMPRSIRISSPRRSFCPSCGKTIPWHQNIPILSWILLRGKCSQCGASIAVRYFLTEVLTACLFTACWMRFGWPTAPLWWLFSALLVVATFIDFEHLIIPDEITIGGVIAGLVGAAIFPAHVGGDSVWSGFLHSLLGAAAGFVLLWTVVEAGKAVFGKKRSTFDPAAAFSAEIAGETIVLEIEKEKLQDIFSRESDELVMECPAVALRLVSGETRSGSGTLRLRHDRLFLSPGEWPLTEIRNFQGSVSSLILPREAMGFGDVKFIAAIGAFLGWQAVLFTVFVAAMAGAVAGVLTLLVTRGGKGGLIPFGPWLALGALIWLFAGADLVGWYVRTFLALPGF